MFQLEFEPPTDLSEDFARGLVARFTDGGVDLPVLSTTAAQLQEMISQPGVEVEDLAKLVQTDQSLSTNILCVANSAAFAPVASIESVPQAISRLGLRMTGELALVMVARDQLFGPLMRSSELVRGMWRHSAVAGVFARRIGLLQGGNQAASILTGLLANVGQPVAFKVLHELSEELSEPLDPELLAYLIDVLHVQLGSLLAQTWRLPAPISVAIAHHHDYSQASEHANSAMTAHLADRLATWCLESAGAEVETVRALAVVEDLGLASEDISVLLDDPEGAREAAAAFA